MTVIKAAPINTV